MKILFFLAVIIIINMVLGAYYELHGDVLSAIYFLLTGLLIGIVYITNAMFYIYSEICKRELYSLQREIDIIKSKHRLMESISKSYQGSPLC